MIDTTRLLRRDWRLIVVVALVGLVGGVALHRLTPAEYQAKTTVRFAPTSEITGQAVFNALERLLPDPTANTRLRQIESDAVLGAAARSLGGTSIDGLRDRLAAVVDVSTNDVVITMTAASPARALAEARAVAAAVVSRTNTAIRFSYSAAIRRIQAEAAARSGGSDAVEAQTLTRLRLLAGTVRPAAIIDPGFVPEEATVPSAIFPGGMGLAFGLMAGLALAALRDLRDRRLHGAENVALAAIIPLLGSVDSRDLARHSPEERGALDLLWRRVTELGAQAAGQVVVVTDAGDGADATGVVALLAGAGTRRDLRVAIVDGNLRRRLTTTRLGRESSPGLVDVLQGRASLPAALSAGPDGLTLVLPAGASVAWPDRLLASAALRDLVQALRQEANVVLVDAGALLGTADALEWTTLADACVLTARTGAVTAAQLAAARAALPVASGRCGIVVTDGAALTHDVIAAA